MMIVHFKYVISVLTFVTMVTHALICQFPHCETVNCESVDPDNCTGTIRMGGGYCGCCKACFTYSENDRMAGIQSGCRQELALGGKRIFMSVKTAQKCVNEILECSTVRYLEPCEYKDALDEILHPPTSLCTTGLYCHHKTSTCQPMPGVGIGK